MIFPGKKITSSELFALRKGAVITTPFRLTHDEYTSLRPKPGDEVELVTETEDPPNLRCRILDIESTHADTKNQITLRITLQGI